MTKHTPATPLTPVQQFYSTHKPGDAIRLAMADHAAHCDPMMPQGDFMRALQKALDRTEAYPRLVEALRFIVQQEKALPQLWETGIDSAERKHNEARNAVLMNAVPLLRELGEDA